METPWLPVIAIFLLGGLVKGAVGFGMPSVVLGLLTAYMPLPAAAALLVLPSLVTNGWQACRGENLAGLSRRVGPLLACLLLATVYAPLGMVSAGGRATTAVLGILLVAYAAFGMSPVRWSIAPGTERWMSPLIGLVCGLLNAATGIFVMPVVPYLQGLQLDRRALVQALALCFTTGTLALALRLHADGSTVLHAGAASVGALAAALAGVPLGERLRSSVNERCFRAGFFIALFALGLLLIAKACT